jgi:hypothetical protein
MSTELTGRAARIAKRAEVIRLRRAGLTWTQISRAVGFDNRAAACREYQRGIATDPAEALATAEQLLALAEVLTATGSDAA